MTHNGCIEKKIVHRTQTCTQHLCQFHIDLMCSDSRLQWLALLSNYTHLRQIHRMDSNTGHSGGSATADERLCNLCCFIFWHV